MIPSHLPAYAVLVQIITPRLTFAALRPTTLKPRPAFALLEFTMKCKIHAVDHPPALTALSPRFGMISSTSAVTQQTVCATIVVAALMLLVSLPTKNLVYVLALSSGSLIPVHAQQIMQSSKLMVNTAAKLAMIK
jgi:hypothetical protein